MCTSDIDTARRCAIFLGTSALTALFGAVYELFSHGVWSPYMVYAFLFPLMLCALPLSLRAALHRSLPSPWAMTLHEAGTATLTVGSILCGVIEIYGTTSRLTGACWVVGALLLLGGLLCRIRPHHT